MKQAGYLTVSLIVLGGAILYASSPAWWKERGVMASDYDETSELAMSENFEAAKIGKLKNLAEKAASELNEKVKGGAGQAINELVASFKKYDVSDPDANYEALTVGQLKFVAKLFYDRLSQLPSSYVKYPEGMVFFNDESNIANVKNTNIKKLSKKYPWKMTNLENDTAEDLDNASSVNVGQLKNMFSFSLTSVESEDSDGDGIPDWWEMKYFGNLTTASGTSCYNGDGISDLQKFLQDKDPTQAPEGSGLYLVVYTPLER